MAKEKVDVDYGEWFLHRSGYYILAQVESSKLCLINLYQGNRFKDAIKVNEMHEISLEEWNKITGGEEFIKIERKIF